MINQVLNAIAERRSIRSYKKDKITREQFDILLKAAQEAPSARNAQSWHFSVVQNRPILDEIYAEVKKNLKEEFDDIFHGAPSAIFLSYDPENKWARFDCGIAVQTIALAAYSMNLGSVILGMPDQAFSGKRGDYFKKLLKFPDGYNFAIAIAIGIPAGTKEAHPVQSGCTTFVD